MPNTYSAAHHPIPSEDERLTRRSRETVRQSVEILTQNPAPDIFVGNKTQYPFPEENKD